jgi:hypothetical protein
MFLYGGACGLPTFRNSLTLSTLYSTNTEQPWKPEVIQNILSVSSSVVSLRPVSVTRQFFAALAFGNDVQEIGILLKFTLTLSKGKNGENLRGHYCYMNPGSFLSASRRRHHLFRPRSFVILYFLTSWKHAVKFTNCPTIQCYMVWSVKSIFMV